MKQLIDYYYPSRKKADDDDDISLSFVERALKRHKKSEQSKNHLILDFPNIVLQYRESGI